MCIAKWADRSSGWSAYGALPASFVFLPRGAGLGIIPVGVETSPQVFFMGVRECDPFRRVRDTVPKLLDQNNPIGHAELIEAERFHCNRHRGTPRAIDLTHRSSASRSIYG